MTMGPKTFRVSEVSKVTRARLWNKQIKNIVNVSKNKTVCVRMTKCTVVKFF